MKRLLVVLALALSACTPPNVQASPEPDASGLPAIPARVASIMGPVSVVWMDTLTRSDGQLLMGGFRPDSRTIYLSRSAISNRVVAWQVLGHERCHVMLFDTGLRNQVDDKLADTLCDAFSSMGVADQLIALHTER